MVGRGILLECLNNNAVEAVLVINRRSVNLQHEKLTEIIHKDFFDFSAIAAELTGYNACYFSLGVSAMGMSEEEYTRMTYDLTMSLAKTLQPTNPEMTFCYISGAGTDSTEKGRQMWARVKGKTENDLLKLGFKDAYAFRPGFIEPSKETPPSSKVYRALMPVAQLLLPLLRLLAGKHIVTGARIAQAMISVSKNPRAPKVIEARAINDLAYGRA